MNTGNPKVSVCLMTYNGAATVEHALTTLLAQTYRDYEIVISDDCSTDDTFAICQRVAAGNDQVQLLRQEQNLDAYHNMRFALTCARGKYFVWACQDDYWAPEFLDRLVRVLEESSTTICAQGRVRRISDDGTRAHDVRLLGRDRPENQSRLSLARSILIGRSREGNVKVKNSIFMHGVWDREFFAQAIEAHRKVFTNERQILCQLALAGDFRYVDELLFYKRFYSVPLHERRPETDSNVQGRLNRSRLRELREVLAAITRSPIIARRVKTVAIPTLLVSYWHHRVRIADEITIALVRTVKFILPQPQIITLRKLYAYTKNHKLRPLSWRRRGSSS